MTIRNEEVARLLDRYAILLEIGRANPFRVRAYRHAVDQARRGWLEAKDVLNARPWPQLKKPLKR